MKIIKKAILFFLLLTLNSCISGIYEMVRGYDKYVEINVDGRKELKKNKFKEKFKPEMAEKINCENVYYSYYEDLSIDYIRHKYLIFYTTGQFAYFSTEVNETNINDLNKAVFVGYYIIKNDKLILETPTGNFNTAHYRVLWNFELQNGILKRKERGTKKQFKEEFKISKAITVNRKYKPNW